jgi:hypothetical protein
MPFVEPPTYSVAELERKAQEVLRKALGEEASLPIDVDLLLEQIEGVDLDYWPGLRANHGLEGMVARDVESAGFSSSSTTGWRTISRRGIA